MKGMNSTRTGTALMTMRSLAIDTDEDISSTCPNLRLVSTHSPASIERLQMANNFEHTPVLASEVVDLFADLPVGMLVDATLGGGGHAELLLDAAPESRLIGIDRDVVARRAAGERLARFGDRVRIVSGTFGDLAGILERESGFVGGAPIVGILADLGVSSPQLDDAARGFSFRSDAPLDMRMDQSSGMTAAEFLLQVDAHELTRLLREHGEGRFAGAIARSITSSAPRTTSELVAAVERAVPPAARRRGHVATRVFQALRVSVNDEENQLDSMLESAIAHVSAGGVVVVISYHSGEDKVVKKVFATAATGGCTCPSELGCVCGAVPTMRVLKASAVLATPDEIDRNPRSRSARLRAAWKLSA